MSIDLKTARHTCNVIRRQIQNSFPDLHLFFCVHAENRRLEAYQRETEAIKEHPAGLNFINYHDKTATHKIMQKNKSRFVSIARNNKPGFLGFLKSNDYIALCFINHERLSNEKNLKNHAYLIAWHAINVYLSYTRRRKDNKKENKLNFIDDNNLIIPNISKTELAFRNLEGDIFSSCIQKLQKQENAISLISEQRINDTLTPQKGFRSEQYPFPACVDQLESITENLLPKFKKEKRIALAAAKMTEEIIRTYDHSVIEKWSSFSLPAQKMAWAGHVPETIIGAALYTCENAYTQSTADMIAEKLNIKPEPITNFQDFNPFTKDETNVTIHNNAIKKVIKSALALVHKPADYLEVLKIAQKQNEMLLNNQTIGWSAGALLRAAEIIKHCKDETLIPNIVKQAEEVFLSECKSLPWDTLNHFSFQIFKERRSGKKLNLDDLILLSQESEEFATLNSMLYALKLEMEEKIPDQGLNIDLEKQEKDLTTLVAKRL